ncbi:methyltransferase domain-containing protein [Aminivibrio sp.]
MTFTRDEILCGALTLEQPLPGPRVNVDTILLSAWVRPPFPPSKGGILEMGCASGAVVLLLALRFPHVERLMGMDIQKPLVEMARRNALANNLSHRVSFFEGDVRTVDAAFPPRSFFTVVMNPPYEAPGRGRLRASREEQTARQGFFCSPEDVARAARHLLPFRGRLYLVFKAARAAELFTALRSQELEPKRIRFVHPLPGRPSSVVLVEASAGGKPGMTVEPPLYIEDGHGSYTEELLRAYTKEGLPCRS